VLSTALVIAIKIRRRLEDLVFHQVRVQVKSTAKGSLLPEVDALESCEFNVVSPPLYSRTLTLLWQGIGIFVFNEVFASGGRYDLKGISHNEHDVGKGSYLSPRIRMMRSMNNELV
jgi:hypothetical protein